MSGVKEVHQLTNCNWSPEPVAPNQNAEQYTVQSCTPHTLLGAGTMGNLLVQQQSLQIFILIQQYAALYVSSRAVA